MVRILKTAGLLNASTKVCNVTNTKITVRNISKYLDKDISAKEIRRRFLDYFEHDCNHTIVRSSPVVPYCDPTVAFVNAGMNQVCIFFVFIYFVESFCILFHNFYFMFFILLKKLILFILFYNIYFISCFLFYTLHFV